MDKKIYNVFIYNVIFDICHFRRIAVIKKVMETFKK